MNVIVRVSGEELAEMEMTAEQFRAHTLSTLDTASPSLPGFSVVIELITLSTETPTEQPVTVLTAAYARVREQLVKDGYDQPMRNRVEVRATLYGLKVQAEESGRRYLDLLSELNEEDDLSSIDN